MGKFIIILSVLAVFLAAPTLAQSPGAWYRTSHHTAGSLGPTSTTMPQAPLKPTGGLQRTTTGGLAPAFGVKNGLPPVRLDSFVEQAGGLADRIYGDEGTNGPPPIGDPARDPYGSFDETCRINYGIATSISNMGLTTGHPSLLPNGWGRDESTFPGPEWSISGPSYPVPPTNPYPTNYNPGGGTFPGADGGSRPNVAEHMIMSSR